MATKKIKIDVVVDDKGSTKKVAVKAKKAEKALGGVAAAAQTADRNLKGAARASSNSTKNFSKMAQGAGGLVGVYATLAAQVFAVSAAFEFLKGASEFNNLIKGQEALGAVTGVAYKTITASIQEATNAQLEYGEAAKSAAIGVAAGLSPDQLVRLGTAAKNTSLALGRDLTDSFNRLIRGVTKAEPELLDELGIILRLDNATRKYGQVIGKAAKDLTEFERSQAVANEVLEQAERKFGQMEDMMDPGTAALNQFSRAFNDVVNTIRQSLAGPVAAIATFLSKNLLALAGVLSIFGASIVKQLIPDMAAWRESAEANVKAQKRGLVELDAHLENTRRQYEKLSQVRITSKADAISKGQALTAGADTKGKKKGAIAFFQGEDSKAAAANAKRVLASANAQIAAQEKIGKAAKVTTGLLAGYNKEQIDGLMEVHAVRTDTTDQFEANTKLKFGKARLSVSKFVTASQIGFAKVKVAALSLGQALNVVAGVLSKLLFWVSLAAIGWELLGAAWDKYYPPTDEMVALNKAVAEQTTHYEGLNEELERSRLLREEIGRLTTTESLINIGNALQSADIERTIDKINALDSSAENFEQLQKALLKTAKELTAIDKGFASLTTSIKDLTQVKGGPEMIRLANGAIEVKQALEQLPSLASEVDQALTALIGTMTKPFGASLLDTAEANIRELERTLGDVVLAKEKADADLEALFNKNRGSINQEGAKEGLGPDAALARHQALLLVGDQAAKNAEITRSEQEGQLAYLQTLQGAFITNGAAIRQNAKSEQDMLAASNTLRTVGITIADKQENITAKQFASMSRIFPMQNKLLGIEASIVSLQAKRDKQSGDARVSTEEQLENAKTLAEVTQSQIDAEKVRARIAGRRAQLDIESLNIVGGTIALQQEQALIASDIADSALMIQQVNSGVEFFGLEQGRVLKENQEELLSLKIQSIQKDKEIAQLALANIEALGEEEAFRHTETIRMSEEKQAALQAELDILRLQGEAFLNNLKGENESLAIQLKSLSLNPVDQKFNTALASLEEAENGTATEEQKMALMEQVEIQHALTEAINAKADAYKSVGLQATSALGDLIKGTESLEDAFSNMAIAILEDLADIIARMLVMKALESSLGSFFGGGAIPGLPTGGAAATGLASPSSGSFMGTLDTSSITSGFSARYGGIMEPPGFASGGIADGSSGGFPATLHGTEAIVPLPNKQAIPVEFTGGGPQSNNVSVNVNIDQKGNTTQDTQGDSNQAATMGNMIAGAVQRELQNQKRSGGILNPYGAA